MLYKIKADTVGVISSSLCLIHCVATPFLFIIQAYGASNFSNKPAWWGLLDFVFLFISFFAVFFTVKNSTKKWIKSALWISWFILAITILDEAFHIALLPEWFIYFPSLSLIVLHLYNRKYCQCADDCCVN